MNTYSPTPDHLLHTPHSSIGHSSHYTLTPPATADQFKKRAFYHSMQEQDSRTWQKQNELKQRVTARAKMISFYKEQALRRENRHKDTVTILRQQNAKQIQKTRRLLQEFRNKNISLEGMQESGRNSLSYSAIHDNTSFDDHEILNSLSK